MNLEIRTAIERATTRRLSLLGLVDVVPPGYWSRQEPGDAWTAREHLDHVATADALLRSTLDAAGTGEPLSRPYEDTRIDLMAELRDAALDQVIQRMHEERVALQRALRSLEPALLDEIVAVPGAVDEFGRARGWHIRQFVAAWAEHDTIHEIAIRRAITTHPDAASLAASAWRRH